MLADWRQRSQPFSELELQAPRFLLAVRELILVFSQLWRKTRFKYALNPAALIAVCGILVVAMTLRMVVLGWSPAPFWDQWDNLISGRSVSWSWLIAQHNEHRLFVPRLVFWLDWLLSAETNIVDYACNVLSQTALFALLLWLALRDSRPGFDAKLWVGGLCLCLLFWAMQYENFLWGFQVQYFLVILFAAGCFTIVSLGPSTFAGSAGVFILSGAAVYTLASGIIVPGLALLLGLWARRPAWYNFVLLFAAVAWPALYLWGYSTPEHHSNPADLFSQLGPVLFYFFVELGGPFLRAIFGQKDYFHVAAYFGSVGLLLYFGALILVVMQGAKPSQKVFAMLGAYLLGAMALVALGRVRFGPAQALSSRYATPVSVFWLSTLLLWYSAGAFIPRVRGATLALCTVITILVVISEPAMVRNGLDFAVGRKVATPALLARVDDPLLEKLLDHPDAVIERRAQLLSAGTSVFADPWTRLMGASFEDNFRVDPRASCSGLFQRVQAIDETNSAWRATGIAWRSDSLTPLRRIIFVNVDGRIVGYGGGGLDSISVSDEADAQTADRPVHWLGDLVDRNPSAIQVYAVDDPHNACLIASRPRAVLRPIALAPLPSPSPELGGFVDVVTLQKNDVRVSGWGNLSSDDSRILVDTNLPIQSATLFRELRPDVVSSLHEPLLRKSGFQIRLKLQSKLQNERPYRACFWSEDPKFGRRLLNDSFRPEAKALFDCGAVSPHA
jgi:hypothetical protein